MGRAAKRKAEFKEAAAVAGMPVVERFHFGGMEVTGREKWPWATVAEVERDGGQVVSQKADGTPLIVLWQDSFSVSINAEEISSAEMLRFLAVMECAKDQAFAEVSRGRKS